MFLLKNSVSVNGKSTDDTATKKTNKTKTELFEEILKQKIGKAEKQIDENTETKKIAVPIFTAKEIKVSKFEISLEELEKITLNFFSKYKKKEVEDTEKNSDITASIDTNLKSENTLLTQIDLKSPLSFKEANKIVQEFKTELVKLEQKNINKVENNYITLKKIDIIIKDIDKLKLMKNIKNDLKNHSSKENQKPSSNNGTVNKYIVHKKTNSNIEQNTVKIKNSEGKALNNNTHINSKTKKNETIVLSSNTSINSKNKNSEGKALNNNTPKNAETRNNEGKSLNNNTPNNSETKNSETKNSEGKALNNNTPINSKTKNREGKALNNNTPSNIKIKKNETIVLSNNTPTNSNIKTTNDKPLPITERTNEKQPQKNESSTHEIKKDGSFINNNTPTIVKTKILETTQSNLSSTNLKKADEEKDRNSEIHKDKKSRLLKSNNSSQQLKHVRQKEKKFLEVLNQADINSFPNKEGIDKKTVFLYMKEKTLKSNIEANIAKIIETKASLPLTNINIKLENNELLHIKLFGKQDNAQIIIKSTELKLSKELLSKNMSLINNIEKNGILKIQNLEILHSMKSDLRKDFERDEREVNKNKNTQLERKIK